MCLALALKYRPFSFDAIAGQKAVSLILKQMTIKDAVPTAMLFTGSRGTGKTSTARILGAALNCDMSPGPCGSCDSCRAVKSGSSLDVLEIDSASNGHVDDIRQLRDTVRLSSGGRKRIIALDEAQSISREGYNALLKMLEEPPPNTIFILLTTEPRKIPETVLSRCMSFRFELVGIESIMSRLSFIVQRENLEVEESLLRTIASRAQGGMRDAIMLLDQVTRVGVTTREQFLDLMGEVDFAPDMLSSMANNDLCDTLTKLDEQLCRVGDYRAISNGLQSCLIDLLTIQCRGHLVTWQGESYTQRKQLAQRLDSRHITNALSVLWTLNTKVRVEDRRSTLELACVVLTEQLGKGQPERRLTLTEMKAM